MSDVWVVAQSTSGKVLRNKSIYLLLAVAVAMMGTGSLYGALNGGMADRYTLDLSFGVLWLIAVVCALIGCFDLPRELRDQTLMTILSKPLGRDVYLIGKFLGVCWIMAVSMGLATLGLLLVLGQVGMSFDTIEIVKGAALHYAGGVQLAAVALLLGVVLSESLAALGTVVVLWLGHFAGTQLYRWEAADSGAATLGWVLNMILPNLAVIDAEGLIVRGVSIDPVHVGLSLALAAAYAAAVLAIATIVFSARDIS